MLSVSLERNTPLVQVWARSTLNYSTTYSGLQLFLPRELAESQLNEHGCDHLRREPLSDSTEPLALFSADKLFLEIKDGLCVRKGVAGCFRNKTEESGMC